MNTKAFPIKDILSVSTGIMVSDKKMQGVYDVMDFFYPGITTIGLAYMQETAAEKIFEQHPVLRDVNIQSPTWKEDLERELSTLPQFMVLTK